MNMKMIRDIVLCTLIATTLGIAYADTQPKSPTQTAAAPDIKPDEPFTITLNAGQWNAIVNSLEDSQTVSSRDSNAVISAIRQQITTQVNAKKDKKP